MKDHHKKESPIITLPSLAGGFKGAAGGDKGWYLYHGCDDVNSGGSGIYQQNSDLGRNVRLDGSGNIYVQHHSGYRMNFSKFDNDGAFQWGRFIPTSHFFNQSEARGGGVKAEEHETCCTVDSSGNLYICGYTNGYSPGPSGNYADMYIAKYNSSGVIQWQRTLGSGESGPGNEYGNGITTDSSGNVYITGIQGYSSTTGQTYELLLVKYNPSGNLMWSRRLVGSTSGGAHEGKCSHLKGFSATIIPPNSSAGNYERVAVFGEANVYKGNTSGNDHLIAVFRASTGDFEYCYGIGGRYSNSNYQGSERRAGYDLWEFAGTHSIVADPSGNGNVYIVGELLTSPYDQLIITKFNVFSHTLHWSRRYGDNTAPHHYHPLGIVLDSSNNPIVAGFTNPVNADSDGCYLRQGMITKFNDSDGSTDWDSRCIVREGGYNVGQSWGCDRSIQFRGIDIDSDDYIYVTGFGTEFTSAGSNTNMMLFKLPADGSFFPSDGTYAELGTAPYRFGFYKPTTVPNNAASGGNWDDRNITSRCTNNTTTYTSSSVSFNDTVAVTRSTGLFDWIYP